MADTQVPVVGPDGQVGTVASGDLKQALDAGATLATNEDVRKEKLEAQYGGVSGMATAGAAGLLSTASLGLSDAAIVGLGGEAARRRLQNYRDVNPGSYFGGQVGGVVLPALVGDPLGVGALGSAAENATARIVGTGAESALGRVAQQALIKGAGAAAEGAIYGVGQEVSDAYIDDHELTAEKLWAGAGKGALIGGAIGAGASTVGQLSREVGSALSRKLPGTSLGNWLEKKSLEATGRAAGVSKKIARDAEARSDFDAMRRIWRDEAPGLVGKRSFSNMTTEDLASAVVKGMERDGEKIGDAIATADQKLLKRGGYDAFPKAVDVIDDVDRLADKLEASKLGSRPMAAKLRDIGDHARQMAGLVDEAGQYVPGAQQVPMSTKSLHDFRQMVDDAVSNWGADSKGFSVELQELRKGLEGRIKSTLEDAGGAELKASYEAAKQKYQAWATLQKAVKNAEAGGASNRFFGMSEQLGGVVGGTIGSAVGGPVGGIIGTGISSLGAHLVRTRGDFIAADLLQKVSQLGSVQRAAGMVDKQIASGIRGFLAAAPAKAIAPVERMSEATRKRTIATAQLAQHLAANDDARLEHVQKMTGNMSDYAPQVAAHVALKAQSSILNLAANAPQARISAATFTPMLEKLRYSDLEIYNFSKYVEGYEEPLSVLNDLKSGSLNPQKLLAVQQNHPRIYEQMRDELQKQLEDPKQELSWDQKKLASIFFGLPADEALTPDFIKRMQQGAQQGGGQDQQQDQQQGGGRRPMEADTSNMQTPAEALAGGITQ